MGRPIYKDLNSNVSQIITAIINMYITSQCSCEWMSIVCKISVALFTQYSIYVCSGKRFVAYVSDHNYE